MEYSFEMLSPFEFELLCQDLLSNELGIRLENFKLGRDSGIDLRYLYDEYKTLVIQCKHYSKSGFNSLFSGTKKEKEKIEKIKPQRYILITSLNLNPNDKSKLYNLLFPYCANQKDIIGGNEVNALLRKFPKVEKTHYKLWLTSTNILELMINKRQYNRTAFEVEYIKRKMQIYVQNFRSFTEAISIIEKQHCCIISGIPGIGKTTLAEILILHYLEMGYSVLKISEDIAETFDSYQENEKQLFYYDDFLGTTGLGVRLRKNEDKDIIQFMKSISLKNNKVFILTTREYILNQAKKSIEVFQHYNFELTKCIIALDNYTKLDRAQILYNHIYFADLDASYIKNILSNKNYLSIINHVNYNPRIIEIMTHNLLPSCPNDFSKEFTKNLDNPEKIWAFAFTQHITKESRKLLLLMAPMEKSIEYNKLFNAYANCFANNTKKLESSFKESLKELEGTFIKLSNYLGEKRIEYHNPSIKDYLENFILDNDIEFCNLLEISDSIVQIIGLYNISNKAEHKPIIKYKNAFLELFKKTIFNCNDNLHSISVEGINGRVFLDDLTSFSSRVLLFLKINEKLGFQEIDDYIKIEYFENIYDLLSRDETIDDFSGLIDYLENNNKLNMISIDDLDYVMGYFSEEIYRNMHRYTLKAMLDDNSNADKLTWAEKFKGLAIFGEHNPELKQLLMNTRSDKMLESILNEFFKYYVEKSNYWNKENIEEGITAIKRLNARFNSCGLLQQMQLESIMRELKPDIESKSINVIDSIISNGSYGSFETTSNYSNEIIDNMFSCLSEGG